ncbi:MAG: D-2-hydroxyacid dehydrogenase [Candidatus Marinimicrobia bacterium]|jgi:D-3-phosphoglycerate dehydrogenase|nr:D-2-hydroxyacid dehydrogenase [Candidatus Neomarinimicrobiota bacterium]
MKILIADGLDQNGQDILKEAGLELVVKHYEPDELVTAIKDYDGIIVRSATKVPQAVIDAGTKLRLIARAGTGIDNIDHQYARAKGIAVLNAPGANSHSVAELVFAHLLALARSITAATVSLREGRWEKKTYGKGIELAGKTLGIIGFGRIGKIVSRLAVAWGMRVIVYDTATVNTEPTVKLVGFEDLLRESDFITLHTPKSSAPLITEKEIAMMKRGVYIVNCARGTAIDEKALLAGLNSGQVGGAGLDVYSEEPPTNLELLKHPRISCTPHIGASTLEAQERVGVEIAQRIVEHLKSL